MSDLDDDLHTAWSMDDLVSELQKDNILADAIVLRVLAARVAARVGASGDYQMLAEDLCPAFESLAVAVRCMVESAVEDDSDELWQVVGTVDRAAAVVVDLKGCF